MSTEKHKAELKHKSECMHKYQMGDIWITNDLREKNKAILNQLEPNFVTILCYWGTHRTAGRILLNIYLFLEKRKKKKAIRSHQNRKHYSV